jgi:hypothetical protein
LSKDFIDIFKDMVEKEKIYTNALIELSGKIYHLVLKSILIEIVNDSLKHSRFYEALAELISSVQPALSQEELQVVSKEIDKHIDTEAKMIELVNVILKRVENPNLNLSYPLYIVMKLVIINFLQLKNLTIYGGMEGRIYKLPLF